MSDVAKLALHPTRDRRWGYSLDRPYWEALGFGAINDRVYAIEGDGVWIVDKSQAEILRLANGGPG